MFLALADLLPKLADWQNTAASKVENCAKTTQALLVT